MSKECLQQKLPIGSPCFQIDVKRTICSLDYCPVAKHLENQPQAQLWDALHYHCVMSDTYIGKDGRGEFIATIAKLHKSITP